MSTANSTFDRVAATTIKNYVDNVMADNVSNHIPFFKRMKELNAVKLDGGDKIVLPLMHEFGAGGSYSGSDTLNIDVQDGISAAEYNWKQLYASATIRKIDELQNSGKSKQKSLIEAITKQAEMTIENKISVMLFGDGTGNGGKDVLGIEALIAQDPTTGILGGIDASVETFWRNSINTSVGSFASGGLAAIQTLIRATQRGTDRTNLIVTGSTIFGYMQTLARTGNQIQHNVKLANLGYEALSIENVDVIFDQNCPADRVYGVNTNWLKLYIHQDANFKMGPMIQPANQQQKTSLIDFAGQLVTNRREALWVASGFTA